MQALGCTHCLSLNRTACKVRLVPGDVKLEEDFVSAKYNGSVLVVSLSV